MTLWSVDKQCVWTFFDAKFQELINILTFPSIPLSKIEFRENNEIVTPDYVMNKLNLSKELFIK